MNRDKRANCYAARVNLNFYLRQFEVDIAT